MWALLRIIYVELLQVMCYILLKSIMQKTEEINKTPGFVRNHFCYDLHIFGKVDSNDGRPFTTSINAHLFNLINTQPPQQFIKENVAINGKLIVLMLENARLTLHVFHIITSFAHLRDINPLLQLSHNIQHYPTLPLVYIHTHSAITLCATLFSKYNWGFT